MDDINDTARAFFIAKIVNGHIPTRVEGGPLDGLEYFPIEICGKGYWLTAKGLFEPPRRGE